LRAAASTAASALSLLGLTLPAQSPAQAVQPPQVTVYQTSGTLADGYIMVGPQRIGNTAPLQGPEIVDSQGRVVWFMYTPGKMATDVRVQTYQGNPVLTWSQGQTSADTNPGDTTDYIVDSTYKVVASVQAGNGYNADIHEFEITPQNTALITIYHNIPTDLSPLGGPADGIAQEGVVQEVDVATGAVVFEWHSLPNIALSESYQPISTAPAGVPYDYFHINSVKLDTDGNLLISSRHTWTVYKVNRTTGAIIWRLGGKKSDFTLGAGLPFAWQHDVEAVDATTLRIFDNESNGVPVLPSSRVIWVSHDDTNKTATLIRSIVHPQGLSVVAEGSAQTLPNGDTFVGWGLLGRFSEFDTSGQLAFDAGFPTGYGTYRAFRFPWTATPASPPIALGYLNADGSIAVHAVWNGATEVASWQILAGDSSSSLSVVTTVPWNGLDTEATAPGNPAVVQVVALDAMGTAIGTSAPVSGPFSPVFPTQPMSQTIAAGRTVVFGAVASGASPSYQWLFNGAPLSDGTTGGTTISGSAGSSLIITGAVSANAGIYSCVATNFGKASTSNPATLSVVAAADAGLLLDVSCRSAVSAASGPLIVGFNSGGRGTSGQQALLIRASGPALAQFGVAGVLPDPDLQLFGASGTLATNVGWNGNPAIAAAASLVGAFPWGSTASADAALSETLPAGPYTGVISGASGDSGIALGEVFDATLTSSRVASTPRLTNLSGRALAGTGAQALIVGFVIGGSASETVLIRASGPELAQFGVTGVLGDPMLQLYQTNPDGTSTLLESNTGWNADAQIAAVAASVGAFSWGAAPTADSALLVTLPPGAYTAEITGASGDSGTSLAEIYEVP
jgi:hypothetical protein